MNLIDELKAALNRDIKNLGYTIWGLEVSGKHNSRHIRVFIDNENSSITLKDCEKVNIQAREVLENSDSLEFSYSLEISSPGIDRTFFEFSISMKSSEIEISLPNTVCLCESASNFTWISSPT